MKKFIVSACMVCAALMLESCYSSTVCVGNMKPETPAVKVNTKHNSHFIGGLIGEGKARAKDYVEDAKDYKIVHQLTFLDYVLSSVTLGIYTPSTTKFYVPARSIKKSSSKKKARSYDDDEDEED
ncbi:MAG: Bor protein [Alphaproteobacteria bacterium]|nr:Bor protein [Alphaproteobacteria bacterium]